MIVKAIQFAAAAHDGQLRKGSTTPYIFHPLSVARILAETGCRTEIVVAGILHDTVEDTPVTLTEIQENFGDEVAALVKSASESDKSLSWEERKRETLEHLATASQDELLLAIADKLDNIRSIRADLSRNGSALWTIFNRPQAQQRWYYLSLEAVFRQRMQSVAGIDLARQFSREVTAVFGSARAEG